MSDFVLIEATIEQMQRAMESGALTSVELTVSYLDRIARFDRSGPRTNAVPILNPDAIREAERADRERSEGIVRGPLHGVPFTVKDSFSVAGLTVAAGSPPCRSQCRG